MNKCDKITFFHGQENVWSFTIKRTNILTIIFLHEMGILISHWRRKKENKNKNMNPYCMN